MSASLFIGFIKSCNGRACVRACVHACMYVCMYICKYVCMYVYMYVCYDSGVVLFSMLNGYLPFDESRIGEMQERMRTQRFTFVRGLSHGKRFNVLPQLFRTSRFRIISRKP